MTAEYIITQSVRAPVGGGHSLGASSWRVGDCYLAKPLPCCGHATVESRVWPIWGKNTLPGFFIYGTCMHACIHMQNHTDPHTCIHTYIHSHSHNDNHFPCRLLVLPGISNTWVVRTLLAPVGPKAA